VYVRTYDSITKSTISVRMHSVCVCHLMNGTEVEYVYVCEGAWFGVAPHVLCFTQGMETKSDDTIPCKGRLRGDSDPMMRICAKDDAGFATVVKTTQECEREAAAYKKLATLDEYADATVLQDRVTTYTTEKFKLEADEDVLVTFDAIRELHGRLLIHGDLKPAHIRKRGQKVVFIDFGCSVDTPLASIHGLTARYSSLDALIRRNAHPLDDYEAVLLVAMESTRLPRPSNSTASRKEWLLWKVQLMDEVFSSRRGFMLPFEAFLADKLLLVWAMPRTKEWISPENTAKLFSDQLHADDFIAKLKVDLLEEYTAALGRAKPRKGGPVSFLCCLPSVFICFVLVCRRFVTLPWSSTLNASRATTRTTGSWLSNASWRTGSTQPRCTRTCISGTTAIARRKWTLCW
jgi:hypothetical protein